MSENEAYEDGFEETDFGGKEDKMEAETVEIEPEEFGYNSFYLSSWKFLCNKRLFYY